MENDVEKFLKAEESAQKLVETLKTLQLEAMSYNTATTNLEYVRKELLNLIGSTEKVALNFNDSIKALREIDTEQILNRVDNTKKEQITKLNSFITQEFSKQAKETKKLTILIILTLATSIIAIFVGILNH